MALAIKKPLALRTYFHAAAGGTGGTGGGGIGGVGACGAGAAEAEPVGAGVEDGSGKCVYTFIRKSTAVFGSSAI